MIVVMICMLRDAKVEQETAESMQTLLKLDTIKARMKAASDALRVSTRHSHSNDNRQQQQQLMARLIPHTDWILISVD